MSGKAGLKSHLPRPAFRGLKLFLLVFGLIVLFLIGFYGFRRPSAIPDRGSNVAETQVVNYGQILFENLVVRTDPASSDGSFELPQLRTALRIERRAQLMEGKDHAHTTLRVKDTDVVLAVPESTSEIQIRTSIDYVPIQLDVAFGGRHEQVTVELASPPKETILFSGAPNHDLRVAVTASLGKAVSDGFIDAVFLIPAATDSVEVRFALKQFRAFIDLVSPDRDAVCRVFSLPPRQEQIFPWMGFEPIILDNPYPEFSEPLIKAGIPKNAVDNAGAEALAELRALSDEKLLFRVISANGEALKHTTDPAKALATAILMELCDALPPNPRPVEIITRNGYTTYVLESAERVLVLRYDGDGKISTSSMILRTKLPGDVHANAAALFKTAGTIFDLSD